MNKLKVYSCEGWKRKRGGREEEEIEKMERRGIEKRMEGEQWKRKIDEGC
jgi:hypothetical protein